MEPSVLEVAPGVHLLGRTFPNASYVVETSAGLALVDTCFDADAGPVTDQMHTAGLDVSRIRCIFLTHVHADHSLGARRLREVTGAKVYAGRGDCDVLRAGAPREAFFSTFSMPGEAHPTPVDVELAGGEVVELGDTRFQVIATPGHTPGSVCYLVERDGMRVLFTGDVVASLTDAAPLAGPGIYAASLSPRFRGDGDAYLASLRKLAALPAPDLVLPGHPRADPSPQSPRVPRARWDALLSHAIARLETIVARRERDGADFLDDHAKELLAGLRYWGDAEGAAVYALVTRSNELYLIDAPDVPDPKDFLRRRCDESGLPPTLPKAVILTSSGAPETDGLRRLVEATGCTVVAPRAGIESVRRACPDGARIVGSEDLPALGWFPVEVIPVDVPEAPSVAYVVTWCEKSVVLGGRYPAMIASRADARGLASHFPTLSSRQAFLRSLDRLASTHADIWLPLTPVQDQNANLYDDDWARAIEADRSAVE